MSNLTLRGQAALDVINSYPGYPSRTLAAFAMQKHPGLFDNAEQARATVRWHRGNYGTKSRAKTPHKRLKANGSPSDFLYPLPEPLLDGYENWAPVPVRFDRALILSDLQIPFHDNENALLPALNYGSKFGPDVIILNGDIVDFYNVSFHDKDPRRRFQLRDEIEHTKAFLEHLRDRFPKAVIYYKEGNHEERLARHAWKTCPELVNVVNPDGTPCVDLAALLDFKAYRIHHVGNKQPILLGEHLYIFHGHEFRTPIFQSVSPAQGLFRRTFSNAICGDVHKTSAHTEPSIDRAFSTWSTGCLCKLRASYMPVNRWNHGFATVEYHRGAWSVSNLKVNRQKVV